MTTGRMLSRKAIAYLADILEKTLRVHELETILDKLELPRSYASDFYKHEKISNILENLNDTKDLDKLLEFLNIVFSEYIPLETLISMIYLDQHQTFYENGLNDRL